MASAHEAARAAESERDTARQLLSVEVRRIFKKIILSHPMKTTVMERKLAMHRSTAAIEAEAAELGHRKIVAQLQSQLRSLDASTQSRFV